MKAKLLTILLFLVSFVALGQECNITKSTVIFFIDANDSKQEIKYAREAGCERGERVVVAKPHEIEAKMKELANQNKAISSLVASGHDGGGSFYGTNGSGSITKTQIVRSLRNAYEGKEEYLESLEGLFLWGCYTSVPDEVTFWRSSLPNLKFILGFHGAGPSNTNISGLRMLKDSLIREGRLCEANSLNQFKTAIRGVNSLTSTLVGAYVGSCAVDESYYYMQSAEYDFNGTLRTKVEYNMFEKFFDCSDLQYDRYLFDHYYSGRREIPEQTTGTDLRRFYTLVRQNAHCFNDGMMTGDRVGNLLFFHDVKKNFAKVFEKEIMDAAAELNGLEESLENLDYSSIDEQIRTEDQSIDEAQRSINDIRSLKERKEDELDIARNLFSKMSSRARRLLKAYDRRKSDQKINELKERLKPDELQALNDMFKQVDEINALDSEVSRYESIKDQHEARKNAFKNQKESHVEKLRYIKGRIRDVKRAFWQPTLSNISNKSRGEVLENIRVLSSLTNDLYFNNQPASDKIKKVKDLETKMERYLHNLDPDCMDFLEWHESLPDHMPTPRC